MRYTPLLPSLPGPLWSTMIAPDRVLSMRQIELNGILMTNWFVWNRIVLTVKSVWWNKTIIMLNWIVWLGTVFHIQTVLMLNWNVWSRSVFVYENELGIKWPTMIDMLQKETKPNQNKQNQTKQNKTWFYTSIYHYKNHPRNSFDKIQLS